MHAPFVRWLFRPALSTKRCVCAHAGMCTLEILRAGAFSGSGQGLKRCARCSTGFQDPWRLPRASEPGTAARVLFPRCSLVRARKNTGPESSSLEISSPALNVYSHKSACSMCKSKYLHSRAPEAQSVFLRSYTSLLRSSPAADVWDNLYRPLRCPLCSFYAAAPFLRCPLPCSPCSSYPAAPLLRCPSRCSPCSSSPAVPFLRCPPCSSPAAHCSHSHACTGYAHHQGARWRVHRCGVEPHGVLQSRHLRLGWPHKVLGLMQLAQCAARNGSRLCL